MFDIYHNFIVKSTPQKVFEAFCSPAGLDSWWTLRSAGKPVLGNSYTFYFGPEHDWLAEVIHVVPGRELTWKMVAAMDDWMPTTVGFKLTHLDNNTSVAFFHKDWQEANEHFGITTFCWGQLLAGLKKYVEEGSIIPFEKRN
ncbi:MAG: SRPBCC domain-containing protein [Cyclobacteriaceae bacterium]